MEGDDTEASTLREIIDHSIDAVLQYIELTIQLDSNRLEGTLRRMASGGTNLRRNRTRDDLGQLQCRLDALRRTILADMLRDVLCETILSIILNHMEKLGFTVIVHDIGSGDRIPVIHPHIERCIAPVAEATLRGIQLVARYTEIEVDPIDLSDAEFL